MLKTFNYVKYIMTTPTSQLNAFDWVIGFLIGIILIVVVAIIIGIWIGYPLYDRDRRK